MSGTRTVSVRPDRGYPAEVQVPPYLADTPETRADLALYYDEVTRMDGEIGRMVAELERRGLRENTLLVYMSDNGMPFPRAKGTVYDEGIRTPLILSWPRVVSSGQVYDRGLVSVVDLAPTFLELAGIPLPSTMQGRSIRDLLTDPAGHAGREMVFSERNWHDCDEHIRSVRSERYRLVHNAYVELPFGSPADVSESPSWRALYERKLEGRLTPAQQLLFQTLAQRLRDRHVALP